MTHTVKESTGKLRPNCAVRSAFEQLELTPWLDRESLDGLLRAVRDPSGKHWRERSVAAWCLGECSADETTLLEVKSALRSLLAGEGYTDGPGRILRAARRSWSTSACIVALVGAIGIFMMVPFTVESLLIGLLYALVVWFLVSSLASLLILPFALPISFGWDAGDLTCSRAEAATALGKLRDPLAAGCMATATKRNDCSMGSAAYAALPLVLEAITEDHYGQLGSAQTLALCGALAHAGADRARLILRALAAAGDGACAEPLARLIADSKVVGRWSFPKWLVLGDKETVVDLAQRVLRVLEERLRQETSAARLLRPAESPGAPGAVLLRPAGSATAVPEEQLLRPSVGPDGRSE